MYRSDLEPIMNMHDMRGLLEDYIGRGGVGVQLSFTNQEGVATTLSAGHVSTVSLEPVTEHHVFKIGSCTKTFVAAALVKMAADGRIDLDASISTWFPEVPFAEE